MKTEKHADPSFTCLMLVCMTTLSNIVWLSSGVPFKLALMQVYLNRNVIFYWFHVFGHVLWEVGIVLQVSFTCLSLVQQSFPASPPITLELNHAVIEKYTNG